MFAGAAPALEPWIALTIAAAFFQNWRTVLQRQHTGFLSAGGSTFARFLFGAPLAILYLVVLTAGRGESLPHAPHAFFAYGLVGAIAQIVGNWLLIVSFGLRNFVVATTYAKSEVPQTALLSALLLREPPAGSALAGIVLILLGVVALSVARTAVTVRSLLMGWLARPGLYGLGVGLGYAIAAVCYRAAAHSLGHGDTALRAGYVLALVTLIQAGATGLYLALREPGQITRVGAAWRRVGLVGVTGIVASACWFSAMAIENVAHVRAVGQIEMLFTLFAGRFVFREKASRGEIIGVACTLAGILLVLLSP